MNVNTDLFYLKESEYETVIESVEKLFSISQIKDYFFKSMSEYAESNVRPKSFIPQTRAIVEKTNNDGRVVLEDNLQKARFLYGIARTKTSLFSENYFDDPSWHIILDLFIQKMEGKRITVSSSCIASLAPPTTGLRHIAHLVEQGVIARVEDSEDRRRVYLELTEYGEEKLNQFLETVRYR